MSQKENIVLTRDQFDQDGCFIQQHLVADRPLILKGLGAIEFETLTVNGDLLIFGDTRLTVHCELNVVGEISELLTPEFADSDRTLTVSGDLAAASVKVTGPLIVTDSICCDREVSVSMGVTAGLLNARNLLCNKEFETRISHTAHIRGSVNTGPLSVGNCIFIEGSANVAGDLYVADEAMIRGYIEVTGGITIRQLTVGESLRAAWLKDADRVVVGQRILISGDVVMPGGLLSAAGDILAKDIRAANIIAASGMLTARDVAVHGSIIVGKDVTAAGELSVAGLLVVPRHVSAGSIKTGCRIISGNRKIE